MSLRLARSLGLATLLCATPSLLGAADHPLQGEVLRLKDPANPDRRLAKLRAAGDQALELSPAADPRTLGATLEISGSGSGDGSTGPIPLPAGRWLALAGGRGYRYADEQATKGVRRVDLRPGSRGGKLIVSAVGPLWPYALTQAQESVTARLTIGGETWCATFAGSALRRNQVGLVIGRSAPAPASCRPLCGNGIAQGSEECDDGNTAALDGCSATCELENESALCRGIPPVGGEGMDAVLVASGIARPTHLTSPPLDPNRLFVSEQAGRVRIIRAGRLLETPFLDIQSKIQCAPSCGERGLLSLAFHPDYQRNGRFFVDYTDTAGNSVIARYQVSDDAEGADVDSEIVLLTVVQPFANHNGGQLAFGPDGYLYIGFGDGGGQGDPLENAQSDTSLLGKVLRLDVDVEAPPYRAIPADNPRAGDGDPLGFIWAKGLRNPWRFSFDRGNGDLYIGDVGQGRHEEIDYQRASSKGGENYGWNAYEGSECFDPPPHFSDCLDAAPALREPAHEYHQTDPGNPCSVTGGFVYRGCRLPALAGAYFFADYCSDRIETFRIAAERASDLRDRTAALDPPGAARIDAITSFGEDARGEIYVLDGGGEIYRIVPGDD